MRRRHGARAGSHVQRLLHPFQVRLSGMMALFNKKVRFQHYEVNVDGERFDGCFSVINVSNAPLYAGGISANPAARFNDGFMDVILARKLSFAQALWHMPGYLSGRHADAPGVFTARRAKRVTVHSDAPIMISSDAEVFFEKSLALELIPAAVDVVAPGAVKLFGEGA
jgi:diacylglycerol kinase (ATP)